MTKAEKLVNDIFTHAHDSGPHLNSDLKKGHIGNFIRWHIGDILKLVKNINETSINEEDKGRRLLAVCAEYNLDYGYFI